MATQAHAGFFSLTYCYDIALSPAQVEQNYRGLAPRFGRTQPKQVTMTSIVECRACMALLKTRLTLLGPTSPRRATSGCPRTHYSGATALYGRATGTLYWLGLRLALS
jgi:hypothetical protein